MRPHLQLLCALFVLPFPALAETPAPKPQLSRDDPNRVICRREAITGSLSQTRKVCMTRADWAARTRDAQAMGTELQERGRINSCGSTTPGAC